MWPRTACRARSICWQPSRSAARASRARTSSDRNTCGPRSRRSSARPRRLQLRPRRSPSAAAPKAIALPEPREAQPAKPAQPPAPSCTRCATYARRDAGACEQELCEAFASGKGGRCAQACAAGAEGSRGRRARSAASAASARREAGRAGAQACGDAGCGEGEARQARAQADARAPSVFRTVAARFASPAREGVGVAVHRGRHADAIRRALEPAADHRPGLVADIQ